MTSAAVRALFARHNTVLRRLCRWAFAISAIAVCILSLIPDDSLRPYAPQDKVSHLIAYSELAALGLLAFRPRPSPAIVLLGVVALGGALEIAQAYVPGRSADLLDFVFNCVGVCIGFVLARAVARIWPIPGRRTAYDAS